MARSHENRLWLVAADWVWSDDGEMVCPGHSVIYDPDGREIARSNEGKEQFIVTDIPANRLFHEEGRRMHGSSRVGKTNAGNSSMEVERSIQNIHLDHQQLLALVRISLVTELMPNSSILLQNKKKLVCLTYFKSSCQSQRL